MDGSGGPTLELQLKCIPKLTSSDCFSEGISLFLNFIFEVDLKNWCMHFERVLQ